ncbi:hypothetical protein B1P84_05700 [Enterococcus faecium]|nr:hypothetical protein B1P84_05700 [Enterococcus faecium]
MNDSIKKMLRITEKDLMITEVSYETLQKKKTLVVDAVLSPTPRALSLLTKSHKSMSHSLITYRIAFLHTLVNGVPC